MDVDNNNSTKVLFPTSVDGRKMINEDDRESDEGSEKYVIKIDNDTLKQDFENELRETSDNTPDNKLDRVEYINECSKEQQQILFTDNRKNQKLLDVQIKRNIESGQTYIVTGETVDVDNNNSTKVLFHKTNVIHLDVKRRLDNEINIKNNILLKEMPLAPVNVKRRGTESETDSPISLKATSKSTPTVDLSSPNSTPITFTYSSKLLSAQNQSIESSAKNKATPNEIGIDLPTSMVPLLKKNNGNSTLFNK